jgi:Spy/CpxP family protein refolding chaperone
MLALIIIVALMALVQLVMFAHFRKVNENIDKLFHEALMHEGKISDHENRLTAHYKDIVRHEQKIDNIEQAVEKAKPAPETLSEKAPEEVVEALTALNTNPADAELNERRAKYAGFRKQGMDIKSAGVAVGVSLTTAKRYEKWMLDNNK